MFTSNSSISLFSISMLSSFMVGIQPAMGIELFESDEHDYSNVIIEQKDEDLASSILSEYPIFLQRWVLDTVRSVEELDLNNLQYLAAQAWQANCPLALELVERLMVILGNYEKEDSYILEGDEEDSYYDSEESFYQLINSCNNYSLMYSLQRDSIYSTN